MKGRKEKKRGENWKREVPGFVSWQLLKIVEEKIGSGWQLFSSPYFWGISELPPLNQSQKKDSQPWILYWAPLLPPLISHWAPDSASSVPPWSSAASGFHASPFQWSNSYHSAKEGATEKDIRLSDSRNTRILIQ